MREKSGAGASVSSGASYQARVGAYVIACQMCDASTQTALSPQGAIATVSFETMEEVDDININLKDGSVTYIQAKAIITFSIAEGGELRSVLDQFRRQARQPEDRLLLVTTSRSSKKITYDLRSALDAYRGADHKTFHKTQPKALSEIIDDIQATLKILGAQENVAEITKSMSVVVLDIEENDPIEQAMVLIIQSKNYIAPTAVWGKLVSDCVTFSKTRRTIGPAEIKTSYARFLQINSKNDGEMVEELVKFGSEGVLSTAREIVLCEAGEDSDAFPVGMYIIEFARFDEDCSERIELFDSTIRMQKGVELKLLHRTATFQGMTRLIERDESVLQDQEVTVIPAQIPDDVEESLCAKIHRQRIKDAVSENKTITNCLHCSRTVFSSSAHCVEINVDQKIVVGLVHHDCLQPSDRVLGTIKSDLFESHSELIDFNVNGWFAATHGGQMVFTNADYLKESGKAVIAWNSRDLKGPARDYVIEVTLMNGEREIVTKRNGVHRFAKQDADAFAGRLNNAFSENRIKSDPYCYSDESKAFGPKSVILKSIGMREKLRPVDCARVRRYDASFAARFSRPGYWYAPLLFLRDLTTGEPIAARDTVFLLRDPLALKRYLDNWKDAGVVIGRYHTESLLNDNEFDDFMLWNEGRGFSAVVDPVLDAATGTLISGRPVASLELLKSSLL